MTHLNIRQGSDVEIVSAQIIKKLYDTALTVSEPLEGETDAAYMSGNLQVNKASRKACTYLTTRFPNLHINVTEDYYIDFTDSEVEKALIREGFSSDGVGVTFTNAESANISTLFKDNTTITSFPEFKYFTLANTTSASNGMFNNCTNLTTIDLSLCTTMRYQQFANSGIQIVNAPILSQIADQAFNHCTNLTTVQSFGNITFVPESCFQGCTSLTTFPFDNITEIRESAFRDSGISGELYCKKLTTFSAGSAFRNAKSITKVLCLGKVNNISTYTFYRDNTTNSGNLTEVYLPYECTSIGDSAFKRCSGLTTLKQYEHSVDNWVEGQTPTYVNVNRITSFVKECFNECSNLTATIDLTNVTEIGESAFRNTKIQVTGTPSQYINIGSGAFLRCSNLTSFDFSNITTLNGSVFYESGLSGTLSIPNLTGVLNGAEFYKCTGLTSITNLGSITSICDNPYTSGGVVIGSFANCTGLTSVIIPSTVTKIGKCAFDECTSLSQVNCTWQNITEVGYGAFKQHADWDFIVNLSNLTTLGQVAFGGYRNTQKKVKQIYLPKITQTNKDAYYQNYMYYRGTFTSLNSDIIYLRDIQSLHPGDFGLTTCTALVINNTIPPVWKNKDDLTDEETTDSDNTKDKVFGGSTITNIYVPDSAVTTYQNDANWSSVANKIQPLSNLTKVATEANLQAGQVALIEAYM